MRKHLHWMALSLACLACGGGDEPPADGGTAANIDSLTAGAPDSGAKPKFSHAKPAALVDTGKVAAPADLVRETYGYSFTRAARDPFRGLTVAAVEGPELPDMRLVSVIYNHTDPKMSVAVFRDIGNKKQYNVHPGDRIGRLVVVSININEATLRVNDFGTTRDQTYSLNRAEDGNP